MLGSSLAAGAIAFLGATSTVTFEQKSGERMSAPIANIDSQSTFILTVLGSPIERYRATVDPTRHEKSSHVDAAHDLLLEVQGCRVNLRADGQK